MSVPVKVNRLPVAGMPKRLPVCVALHVQWSATRFPSAMSCSTVICTSEMAAWNMLTA